LLVGESLVRLLDQQQYFRLKLPRLSLITSTQEDTAGEILPSASTSNDPEMEDLMASQTRYQFSRTEIQAEIKRFIDQWKSQVDRLIQVTNQAPLLQVDKEVQNRLEIWLRASSSTNLWIQGPQDVRQPSQKSMTAVSLAALARKNSIPGLAQGTLSVLDTLHLILDIRSLGPRVVYGFIDNIQVLEDQSDQDYTQDFLRTIATLCRLDRGASRPNSAIVQEDEGMVMGTRICFTRYVDGLAQASELQLLDKVEFDLETNDPLSGETGGGPE
jgi:hypothetical protein